MLTLPTAHIFFENIAMLHFKMNLFNVRFNLTIKIHLESIGCFVAFWKS